MGADAVINEIASITYVWVDPDYRGMNLAFDMLEYLSETLNYRGYKAVAAYLYEGICQDGDELIEEVLDYAEFTKLDKTRSWMKYTVKGLKDSPIYKKLDDMAPILEKVKTINYVSDDAIIDFRSRLSDMGKPFDKNSIDPDLGRFFIDNGEITGYLNFREDEKQNTIYVADRYINSKPELKFTQGAMSASFLKTVIESKNDSVAIIFPAIGEAEYAGLMAALGRPEDSKTIQIFRRDF